MYVTVYNPESGEIIRCVDVFNPNDAHLQAGNGEAWVAGFADEIANVVIDNKIKERPKAELEQIEIDIAMANLREARNYALQKCDWTQAPDAPVDQAAWAAYRQALRDLPSNTTDPRNPVWPSKPA